MEEEREMGGEKKPKKIRRPSRIAFCLMSFLTIVLVGLNALMLAVVRPYYGFLNNFLAGAPETKEAAAATQNSADITREVEGEGIVLLKNNGGLPLTGETKINVFGSGILEMTYGGTGSGSGDSSKNVTLLQGLADEGFAVNEEILSFYEENAVPRTDMGLVGTDFGIYEVNPELYTEDMMEHAKGYSDVALLVLTRVGGEGDDLPLDMEGYAGGDAGKHYLELQESEKQLLSLVEQNFGTVVVVLNSPNVMELGFLWDSKIDAAVWIGCPGSTGCAAVAKVLSGELNPSGRTADTFAYEVESNPTYYNFGDHDYSNITYVNQSQFAGTGDAETGQDNYHYVEYIEGIYVGYRYYETAAADGFINYDDVVQFPFGYGLSYTTFEKEITGFSDDGTNITMEVTVTNTGKTAGKDVVEVYYSAPYYEGGIEKSEVVLAGFAKTGLLGAGEKETAAVTFTYEDMASYDYSGVKAAGGAYVLEAGEYEIRLQEDSHTVLDRRSVTVAKDVIYDEAHDGKRSTDFTDAKNQFADVSDGANLVYLSRADWAGTMPGSVEPAAKEATEAQIAALETSRVVINEDDADITFAKHGLKLADMKGLPYDDPKWEQLLEQLSVDDMTLLIGNGGWSTFAIGSIGKPYYSEIDGPNGLNNIMAGVTGNQMTGQSVLAMTWNTELAERMGRTFGEEAVAYDVTGLYAPALNIHRNPYSGRNYEYMSEDGTLTGKMGAAEIRGIQSAGVYCYTKHFAANDQETNRDAGGLVTWLNEQAFREIYLKGFELAVKEGKSMGIMSSFNRIGTTPVAESYPLLTTVLRDEWGFVGAVITDCVMACWTEDVNASLLAGNDLQLTILGQGMISDEITGSVTGRQALRNACHNILYMQANSGAVERIKGGMTSLEVKLIVADLIFIGLLVLYYVRRHLKMKRWKQAQLVIGG